MMVRSTADVTDAPAVPLAVRLAMASIDPSYLEGLVRKWAVPRHNLREAEANRRVAGEVQRELIANGYDVTIHGASRNLLAARRERRPGPGRLVGAHYDSVPGCPGADDNASALAALVACAKATSQFVPDAAVRYAVFNCEEDGLVGSRELVKCLGDAGEVGVTEAHVLEMVGYCCHDPGSQRVPSELPIAIPDTGDFLGLVANQRSIPALRGVLACARAAVPELPVFGLEVAAGWEAALPVLSRSDHASFWQAAIPGVMWTDTAEYRNPHYHQRTDTPDTLDYEFLARVTRLAVAVAAIAR